MNFEFKFFILKKYGTQTAFGRACGKNDNWVSRIVTGRQQPSKADLDLISTKLGLKDIDALFDTHNSNG